MGLLLVSFVGGCQRPFADEGTPGITVISPDLSIDQEDPEITLQIESKFTYSSVTQVFLDDTEMIFNNRAQTWSLPVTLQVGLNALVVTSYVENGNPGIDTLYALHMPYEIDPYPGLLPIAVGGHTATLVPPGDVVVAGGAPFQSGEATDRVQVLKTQTNTFTVSSARLNSPRVGHTATFLGDGRLLVIGGALREEIASTSELVESVEIYSSESGAFQEIPVIGDPIRRMYHTASYRNSSEGTIVDLVGGTGDVQYTPESVLGVRRDMRSFVLQNDTLFALHPGIGPTIEPMTGHTQIPLQFLSPGQEGIYLVNGFSRNGSLEPRNFVLDFASPYGIEFYDTAARYRPSIHMAGERLRHDVVALFGGVNAVDMTPINASEIFFGEIDRYFMLLNDPSNSFFNRTGHTATFLDANRILIIGGFDESGAAQRRALIFSYSL